MNIVIIGTGEIANKAYFPLLRTLEDVNIIAVMSRTAISAEKAQNRWQIPRAFTNMEDVINLKPDACLVLTDTTSHYQIVQELLKNDIDVFVEKPATTSSEETKALADLAEQKKRILMVGFNRRFADFYIQAKNLIAPDEIMQFTLEKHRRNASHISLYSQYLDDTIHIIDLLRFFDPNPTPIQTFTTMADGRLRSAVSLLRLSSGGLASIQTCLDSGGWQEKISLHGSKKSVIVNAFRDLTYIDSEGIQVFGPERPGKWKSEMAERGFADEVLHFFDCVKTRNQSLVDGYEAYKTQLLVEKLIELGGEPLDYHEIIRDSK